MEKAAQKHKTRKVLNEKNEHLYYCSQGLKRAEIIYKGRLAKDLDEDFSNGYVKIKRLQALEEAVAYFTD